MKAFQHGQRVVVSNPDQRERLPLRGMIGTVHRLRRGDELAWIRMDDDLPEGFCSFPALTMYKEPEPRHRDILMHPQECEPVETAPKEPR